MRIGLGYDVHPLTAGRKLVLGGVVIPYAQGLAGHSDADVLTHALMDAVLGAAALGSIGEHFPDTDPAYRGINSLELLENVNALLISQGYKVSNADCVIICQEPRLAPYIQDMQVNISAALGVSVNNIGIKATTTERLGFAGRGEGIAAEAVVLIDKI
ncbi:2-C-methyl-D-erythritol 2,4-cyclodiphosphate synthase [Candidatus Termititenax persephonae]|uniref:2-C-methyl-D-erythritol 2,4-cyclodiphosphate synthase n=1 Tax=Candidatus Termititenax persephonae TaxID=2218525 RepID=A0A388THJ6_9BACT|nr:2-C-methyl-D-erythritol 2,4-cyclodiphosphate synthase [Candidatus Termititenax persephonae]